MKYTKIIILLLILVSSHFILTTISNKEAFSKINSITTKTILTLNTKATAILFGLSVQVDDGFPRIYINSPLNKTYNYNNSIGLNFTAVDSSLDKIYYNIDDGGNITITTNTTFSVSSTNSHILKLFANDTLGQLNSSSVTFSINLSKGYDIDYNKFNEGQTTNLGSMNITQLQNLSNVKLEKLNNGIIEFIDNINISKNLNISQYINISFNKIELDSNNLPEFNKNATLKLYNLTFTNPRILKDGNLCSSPACNKNSYSNGILSFNVTGFTVYSSEETPSTGGTGSSGGGGGSSGGGRAALTDFSISTNLIKVSLLQGETKREVLEIENAGKSILDLQIDLQNIQDLLIFPGGVSKYTLQLKPGEKQILQLIFNAPKDYKSGVYPGKIIISSPLIKKIITTIVEIESPKKIFDVDVKLQEKNVVRGDSLQAEIVIFNLGKDLGRVDADVEIGIKDLDGNTIGKQFKKVAVETQASFLESILVPKYLAEGRYIIYAIVTFDHEVGTATEIFQVITTPTGFLALSTLWIYIIPGFVSLLIIIIVLFELKHSYRKKYGIKKHEPSIITKITQKPKEKFDINELLKEINHGDHKKTLESKLKILKQNYDLGLINENEYLKSKQKIENSLRKFI